MVSLHINSKPNSGTWDTICHINNDQFCLAAPPSSKFTSSVVKDRYFQCSMLILPLFSNLTSGNYLNS